MTGNVQHRRRHSDMRQGAWKPGVLAVGALGLAVNLLACQPATESNLNGSDSSSVGESSAPDAFVFINGAGASFPALLYDRWFAEYASLNPQLQVSFQPVGSGAGIQQMLAQTVDLGASDIAMTDEEIAQVERGVVMLPVTGGNVAIAYNLPGIDSGLRLSRAVYPRIFLGEITRWNDPAIASLNPDLDLPDAPITVVHRSDGSGTTATVTDHFEEISPTWADQVGSGLNVQWPAGIGIKSNAGVSAQIQQAENTLGYVEFSFAQQLGLAVAALENKAGEFVIPTVESTAAALATVELPENLRGFVADPPGADSYPIVTYSWLLAYQTYDDPAIAQGIRDLVAWSLREGQTFSEELGFVPLPLDVVERVEAKLSEIGTAGIGTAGRGD